MSVRKIARLGTSVVVLFALVANHYGRAWDRTYAEAKLHNPGDVLVVPVRLPFGSGLFIIDTAAVSTVLDNSFLSLVKQKAKSPPREITSTISAVDVELELEIGSYKKTIEQLMLANLAVVRDGGYFSVGAPVVGVLGMDVLQELCLEIDVTNGVVRLCDGDASVRFPHEMPMVLKKGRPFVSLTIDGKTVECLIDTSTQLSVHLEGAVFDGLAKPDKRHFLPEQVIVQAEGQHFGVWYCEVQEVRVGPLTAGPVFVAQGMSERNIVGQLFLCRFDMRLDFKRQAVQFAPSSLFSGRDASDSCGLTLFPIMTERQNRPAFVVSFMRKGSVAEAGGVQLGDRIFRVSSPDGTWYEGVSMFNRLCVPRVGPLRVFVERDGKVVECEIQ